MYNNPPFASVKISTRPAGDGMISALFYLYLGKQKVDEINTLCANKNGFWNNPLRTPHDRFHDEALHCLCMPWLGGYNYVMNGSFHNREGFDLQLAFNNPGDGERLSKNFKNMIDVCENCRFKCEFKPR